MGPSKAPINLYCLVLGLEMGRLLCEWMTEMVLTTSQLTHNYSLAACNNNLF